MEKFMGGYIVGAVLTGVVWLMTLPSPHNCEVKTDKKIEPDWELVAKGKTVDTLYTYKVKQ